MRIIVALGLLWSCTAVAQDWNVSNPPGDYREVSYTVDEGTWMNLDVSPDGKQIVFDLLGDIFIMTIQGGNATCLRSGLPFEVQPRVSPDGKQILFTSDAGGGDNIWVMQADGSQANQITKEDFRLLNNAVWSPDGDYFVARKHFTSTRSAGAGEIWLYHKSGGSGVQLTKRKNDQQDVNEPFFSHDGRYIYYSEDSYPGGYFQYNKDPNSQIYVVKRYDRNTGNTETILSGPGGAFRPTPSPDRKYIAFLKRVRTKTVLFLHDIESGLQWPVCDEMSKDQQEAWALFGVYTGFNWTPDSKNIIFWAQGKINKLNIESLEKTIIPFQATLHHKIRNAVKHEQVTAPDSFDVKMIRNTVTSPDGTYIVFSAAGYLWKKNLPNGKPSRLSKQNIEFEFEPTFSGDGKYLVYVTWSDAELGKLVKMDLKTGKTTVLNTHQGIFRTPSFSNDGKQILYWKEKGNDHQGYAWCEDAGIYAMPANGGERKLITKNGQLPRFSTDANKIFYQVGNDYYAYDLNEKKETKLIESDYATKYTPSPDNKWIAFTDLHKVYVAALPKTGNTLKLAGSNKNLPIAQFDLDAGTALHWLPNSETLCWTLGDTYFSRKIEDRFTFLLNTGDSIQPLTREGIRIGLRLAHDKPKTTFLFQNARIITVDAENKIIENGYVFVHQNKILAVGEGDFFENRKADSIIRFDSIIDCKGKTIMPGLVDVHAHLWTFRQGIHPQKYWPYYANLAFGVTTTHDPSSNTEMVFTQSEMVKTGNMVGPRIFSTGTILYGADGDFKAVVNNLEDAYSHVYRTKAFGAFSVKSYNQPRRNQRQQIIHAADSQQIMVYPEGGSHFYHNMSMILDGHTGVEHNIPVAPVYQDVTKLWAASNTGYTPTLIVCYGSVSGEYYWYQKDDVWKNDRLMRFTPRSVVDSRARHRTMIPDEEYENGHILVSQSCKKLSEAGVKVNLGSHGQLEGLGAHWELWMLAQGGMSNLQVIRSVTFNGAHYIGMDKYIGSLEKGKLADLLILDENPIIDIKNTEKIRWVMANGRLYNAANMTEFRSSDEPVFWFQNKKYAPKFVWNEETQSFSSPKCICGKH